MNKSNPQTDSDLKVGDRVRLVPATLAWKAEMMLRGKTGEVIECRDDGRSRYVLTIADCSVGASLSSSNG
jgi:hypothetical protein